MQEKLNVIKAMWKEAETLADPVGSLLRLIFMVTGYSLFFWVGDRNFVPKVQKPGSATDQKNLLVRNLSHVFKGPERRLIRRRNSNHTDSYLLGECYSFYCDA